MIISELRLVVQSRNHHPHGIYSGTTNCYALQYRESKDAPWRTCPVAMFDELSEEEIKEIAASQNVKAESENDAQS